MTWSVCSAIAPAHERAVEAGRHLAGDVQRRPGGGRVGERRDRRRHAVVRAERERADRSRGREAREAALVDAAVDALAAVDDLRDVKSTATLMNE